MNRAGLFLIFLFALLAAGPAAAQGRRHIEVRLVAETASVAPGSTVTLAFTMRPAGGWHGYWRNPGDAGDAPRVTWRLPEGWRAGALRYPVPDRLLVQGLMNYVYERDYALLVDVQVPPAAEPGATFPVDARIDYLVCTREVCVPEDATVSVELAVGAPRDPSPAFQAYRQALPRPLAAGGRFEVTNGRLRLAVPLPPRLRVSEPYFFPGTLDALRHSEPQRVSRSGDMLIVESQAGARAARLETLEGVLEIAPGLGLALTAHPGAVPAAGVPVAGPDEQAAAAEGPGILLALLGALLGGLILNIMPCVFPILSLKALSLARAGGSESEARREALAYAAGAVLTCLALGGLLLGLRAGGAMVGWAFQLQDPRVILLLLLLVTAISLNLAGLFRLPMLAAGDELAGRGGTTGAFFTGALAAFIATPCTGPFMGAALGAALVLPAAGALAVFAGLGLGLALPFLLLGFVPALRRRLPKPGQWLATFQRLLSLPMFLTALGLAWILGRQTGPDGMALGLAGALGLGLALWWLGKGGRWLAGALILAAAAVPLLLLDPEPVEAAPAESPLPAEPFSEARLAQLRAEGAPVFLYFTADWCLTCKVNERGAMAGRAVAEAFRAKRIRVLVGDWTRGDPAIGAFLERHGRSGVPLYLFYPPGREAEVLPQLLTAGRLAALGG
jgi:thiol:disulfide interchange protein/DsbC/DsbD-like thiol-disulfide interchange protein